MGFAVTVACDARYDHEVHHYIHFLEINLPLAERNIHDVFDEVVSLAGRWQSMCNGLKLLPSDRDSIALKCHNDPENCLMEVMNKWLQKSYDTERHGPPTWQMLVAAVASCAGGNNPALAKEIAENHQSKDFKKYSSVANCVGRVICQIPDTIYYRTHKIPSKTLKFQ